MGDNFLKQQAGNFKKRRDLAVLEMGSPSLFDRPEVIETLYTARPLQGTRFCQGEVPYAVLGTDGEQIDLLRGHQRIGYVCDEGAAALRDTLREPDSGGIARLRIVTVSPLSGVGKARVE